MPHLARALAVLPVLALAIATADRTAANATQPDRLGAISGVVIDASTGRPLRGAAVALSGAGVRVSVATLTDAKGRFVFTDLPAFDAYSLSATRAGYGSGELLRQSIRFAGASLALAAGEWRADLTITMWPLGSISGTVIDERGEPVVDVPVRVLTRIALGGAPQWATGPTTRTDDRGEYRFGDLRRGTYVINVPSVQSTVPDGTPLSNVSGLSQEIVRQRGTRPPQVATLRTADGYRQLVGQYPVPLAPGGRPQSYPQTFSPSARSLSTATRIELGDGEARSGVVVALTPVPSSDVSGTVTGPADVVAGLSVRLVAAGAESLGPGAEQATAMTSAGGEFRFVAVPAGSYTLRVSVSSTRLSVGRATAGVLPAIPGVGPARGLLQTFDEHALVAEIWPGAGFFATQAIIVGEEDLRGVTLSLRPGARLEGRIVRDDGGALPDGIRVSAEAATADPALGVRDGEVSPTATGGRQFRIEGLPPGEYILRVTGGNLQMKSVIAAGVDLAHRPIEVEPGRTTDPLEVVMTASSATVLGAIRDPDGRTSPAAIIVFPAEPARWSHYGFRSARIQSRVSFGPEGYRIGGLPAGEYFVVAVDSHLRDAWRDATFLQAAARQAERVTLSWGEETRRDLTVRRNIR